MTAVDIHIAVGIGKLKLKRGLVLSRCVKESTAVEAERKSPVVDVGSDTVLAGEITEIAIIHLDLGVLYAEVSGLP